MYARGFTRVGVIVLGLALLACDGRPLGALRPGQCTGDCVVAVHYVGSGEYWEGLDSPIRVTDGWVVYLRSGTTYTNAVADQELWRVRSTAPEVEQQVTADDAETRLLDARGQAVLWATRDATDWDQASLSFLREDGVVVPLGRYPPIWLPVGRGGYASAPRRWIDGNTAAWVAGGAIHYYDGAAVRVGGGSARGDASSPWLDAGRVVFSAWDGTDQEIFGWEDGRIEQLTDDDARDEAPASSRGRVLWACPEGICRLADGVRSVLDRGECLEPDVDGDRAAWICDGRLRRWDGALVHALAAEAVGPVAVRIHGERLAWLETGSGAPGGYGPTQGSLRLWNGWSVQTIAPVGLPCMMCDAYWPPLELTLSGDLLAWSYALEPADPEPTWPVYGTSAWARITDPPGCGPSE